MPFPGYFEGPAHDFFVKPVILGASFDGELSRWATPEDGEPDVWTVYALPVSVEFMWISRYPLSDHLTRQEADAEAERHHQQDKLAHLLGAQYHPSTGRIIMPK